MYVRKKKVSPFISGAKCQGFGKAEDIFEQKPPPSPESPRDLSGFGQGIVDAETGEPIQLSTARWNVTEGRLNLDTATILAMGTGRLDIKKRAQEVEANKASMEPSAPDRTPAFSSTQGRNAVMSRASTSSFQSPPRTAVAQETAASLLMEPEVPVRAIKFSNITRKDTAGSRTSTASTQSPPRTASADPPYFLFSSAANVRQASWNGLLVTESRAVTAEDYQPLSNAASLPTTPAASQFMHNPSPDRMSPLSMASAQPGFFPGGNKHNKQNNIGGSESPHKRHPLISQFLKTGPINPMSHIHWDPRSNTVITVDEDGQPLDLAEEGVEFSSDDDDGSSVAEGDGSPGSLPQHHGSRSHSVASAYASATSSVSSGSSFVGSKLGRGGKGGKRSKGGSVSSGSRSLGTKKSGASKSKADPNRDTTLGLVDDSIVMSNRRNWQAIEERVFQEIFALAWEYEHNKSLTGEEGTVGGLQAVRLQARELARLKVKGMRELVQANADEKVKEDKRAALEAENASKLTYLIELQKVHEEERKKSRRYLNALEQDNEIILIRKMTDLGWLW